MKTALIQLWGSHVSLVLLWQLKHQCEFWRGHFRQSKSMCHWPMITELINAGIWTQACLHEIKSLDQGSAGWQCGQMIPLQDTDEHSRDNLDIKKKKWPHKTAPELSPLKDSQMDIGKWKADSSMTLAEKWMEKPTGVGSWSGNYQ